MTDDERADLQYELLDELRSGQSPEDLASVHQLTVREVRVLLAELAWQLDALRCDFLDDAETLRSLQDDAVLIVTRCRLKTSRVNLKPLCGAELQLYLRHQYPARYLEALAPYRLFYGEALRSQIDRHVATARSVTANHQQPTQKGT